MFTRLSGGDTLNASDTPRPVAWWMTAGLLAHGSKVLPAFPAFRPVAWRQNLTAYSCGGSHGFGPVQVFLTVFPIIPSGFASGTVTCS